MKRLFKQAIFSTVPLAVVLGILWCGVWLVTQAIPTLAAETAYTQAVSKAEGYDRDWILGRSLSLVQMRYREFGPQEEDPLPERISVQLTPQRSGLAYCIQPWVLTLVLDSQGTVIACLLEQV